MSDFNQDLAIDKIISLMNSYSFDTERHNAEELIQQWLKNYNVNWIYLATIEALYLGRYKAISIEQIMYGWSRRGQPTTHFGGDFERVICRKLPRHLSALNSLEAEKNTPHSDGDIFDRSAAQSFIDNQDNLQSTTNPNTNFTSSANPLISTQVTPFPSTKKKENISQHRFDRAIKKDSKDGSQGIETFQPLPDASSFFQKLKAFADHQRSIKDRNPENNSHDSQE